MQTPVFTKINESFVCEGCGRQVPPSAQTCRNHCPFCLTSKHLDIKPGDRAHSCKGLMDAVGYDLHKKKGVMIIFKCRACGELTRNKALLDDPLQADDYDRILSLSRSVDEITR